MRLQWVTLGFVAMAAAANAAPICPQPASVCPRPMAGSFPLIREGQPAAVYVDDGADAAVRHVATSFADDLARVSGRDAILLADIKRATGPVVIIGVAGQSPVINALVQAGKIDVRDLSGQWEAYRQIVVDHPFANIARALVIVGADRRGAVFGAYDYSEKMGVSPLYWLADVPAQKHANLYITAGSHNDRPKVKYRGIFINDEAPAFSTWTAKKFGGANAKAYEHIFEMILRMKGNYLWPAMWAPRAFNADDPKNMVLADEMGVVMGTSHHEPMTRAQDEWHRNTGQGVTGGKWDYTTNDENLRRFWRGGIERMTSKGNGQAYENVVTLGMRGDGDEPMSEGTATKLLETIVADQRKIIADVTGKPADQTPQVWALYKEVQDYYDRGMTVPDDVTLLFSDDNWGQIRRLPTKDFNRKGGFGVYYHFDYVGGPRNYKWINTNQIEKTWQQMDLAYRRGAKTLWVVNVGDIKPMEYPIGFFLKMAWDPEAMGVDALARYPQDWANATFGAAVGPAIGRIVTRYSQLAARRKPELIDATSFPLGDGIGAKLNGGEFGQMIGEWQVLVDETAKVKAKLSQSQQDAYFELVEHPVLALANLYQLYYAVAWNRRLAEAKDNRANAFADRAEAAFRRDQELSQQYHKIAKGKWDGMMLQVHIGYSTWHEPENDIMPTVSRVPGASPKPVFATSTQSTENAIALEAGQFSRSVGGKGMVWQVIPHLGRTQNAVTTLPQGQAPTTAADGIRLEYDVDVKTAGDLHLQVYVLPSLDTIGASGLKLGVSVDDGPMRELGFNLIPSPNEANTPEKKAWEAAVSNNAHLLTTAFPALASGRHTIKLWRLDDNVVVQRLVVASGALPETYLGPR